MLQYSYNAISGKLWSDSFEAFCEGLRDLCGLDVDTKRSDLLISSYEQYYFIAGKEYHCDRDGMPKFLASHGIANDELRSRAQYGNWELYLTNRDGLEEKYDELLHVAMKGDKAYPTITEVVEETLVSLQEVVEGAEEDGETLAEDTPATEEITQEEVTTEESAMEPVEIGAVDSVEDVTPVEEETEIPSEPDFEYAKSFKDDEDGVEKLKAYASKFDMELGGKNFKGSYLSFTNKWKKMQKDAAKG